MTVKTALVSFGHCIDCPSIYGFWWRRWYLLAIVLTVLLFTASDYHVGIFWQLYWLSFYLRLLITTLVSFGHCIDCPSIYGFWWPPWYLLTIVLTVLLFTASDDHVGIFWPLYWLSFYLRLLMTPNSKDRQYNGQKIPTWSSEGVTRRTDNTMAKIYQRGHQKP
jgi:hypothetical protein